MAEPGFWQYTVVGTPCRRSSAEIEFLQSGLLARGQVSEQQPSEVRAGPPLNAKASRSKIQNWSVTQIQALLMECQIICIICNLLYAEKYANKYAINMLNNMHNMHNMLFSIICKICKMICNIICRI